MANYDEFKKKAKDAIETIADVSAEAYRIAEEKARIFAKKAKLNAEIAREKAQIRRLRGSIGAKYYEMFKENPDDALKADCEGITESFVRIRANRREIEELKKRGTTCDCGCETDADTECCDEDAAECCAEGDTECCAESDTAADAETEPAPEAENAGE